MSAIRELEDYALSLEVAHRNGKILVGSESVAKLVRMLIKAIKEKEGDNNG